MGLIWTIFFVALLVMSFQGYTDKKIKPALLLTAGSISGLMGIIISYLIWGQDIEWWADLILVYLIIMFILWIIGIMAYVFNK